MDSAVWSYLVRRKSILYRLYVLNGILLVLVYADDVNILGGSVNTMKKTPKLQ
jgi:hypothetical protein